MLNVFQAKLLTMQIPLPPLKVQERFGHVVWRVHALRQRLTEALLKAESLSTSIMAAAFTSRV